MGTPRARGRLYRLKTPRGALPAACCVSQRRLPRERVALLSAPHVQRVQRTGALVAGAARAARGLEMASTPRGLLNFIRDIRNCANKEDEKKRVNVELANIRERKKCARRSSRPLLAHAARARRSLRAQPALTQPCQTLARLFARRYVWKLLYIYMLGYDVEFGHMEAVGLISSPKYAEKQVGYMVTSVLLNEVRACKPLPLR
jgi:hypothetical protein